MMKKAYSILSNIALIVLISSVGFLFMIVWLFVSIEINKMIGPFTKLNYLLLLKNLWNDPRIVSYFIMLIASILCTELFAFLNPKVDCRIVHACYYGLVMLALLWSIIIRAADNELQNLTSGIMIIVFLTDSLLFVRILAKLSRGPSP